ncbi:hypothetical protein [Paenibacillus tianjinensis]|uniref:Uncharacterized protein n=1 Tax=Paenibacillus tianjinensis TaxID=2810347 RepID=A0ABX7LBD7_9BACL|nr:hypothetical protein [Paenibacillus tianjinensis]QSF43292.1 hypothetical protein JRJ22_18670 [Paenibacillus tianjinensis]
MVKNNKAIMASVLEAVKSQFNVRARGIIENRPNEVFINIHVADIPQSFQQNIANWVMKQGFELPVFVDTYVTEAFQERIDAKCAEMDAQYTIESDRRYMSGVGCKQFIHYNGLDQRQAAEALWIEDKTGVKAVFEPVFKNKNTVKELQYA